MSKLFSEARPFHGTFIGARTQPYVAKGAATSTVGRAHYPLSGRGQLQATRSHHHAMLWTAQAKKRAPLPTHAQGVSCWPRAEHSCCMFSLQTRLTANRRQATVPKLFTRISRFIPPLPCARGTASSAFKSLCFSEYPAPGQKSTRDPSLKARRCITSRAWSRLKPHPWFLCASHLLLPLVFVLALQVSSGRTGPA